MTTLSAFLAHRYCVRFHTEISIQIPSRTNLFQYQLILSILVVCVGPAQCISPYNAIYASPSGRSSGIFVQRHCLPTMTNSHNEIFNSCPNQFFCIQPEMRQLFVLLGVVANVLLRGCSVFSSANDFAQILIFSSFIRL